MRYSRQNKILEIINSECVETQEQLVELLKQSGYNVTQATISRDIKDLQLIKTLASHGRYKYIVADSNSLQAVNNRFQKIFRETIQSINSSGNIIVIKTLNGCANAAGEAIDTYSFSHVIGSIAGDNTIFLLVDDPANIQEIKDRFNEIMK